MTLEYFQIFGFEPVKLDLDLEDLEKRYYELAKSHHPDKHFQSEDSVATTAKLNLAYKVLRDPWARALYILGSTGVGIDSKAVPKALAEIYFAAQESQNPQNLKELQKKLLEEKEGRNKKLKGIFQSFDQQKLPLDPSSLWLKELKNLVTENTYANSMLRDIDAKLAAL